jgi:F-type H+-transporting ATPase subunit b
LRTQPIDAAAFAAPCESRHTRRRRRLLARVGLLAAILFVVGAGQRMHAQQPASPPEHAETSAHGESAHEESLWPFVGKLVNFAVLAGVLVYYLRAPIAGYLASRKSQVRADLESAERLKTSAAAQIVELDARLKALPAEIEALKARGRAEISAEEQRIRELAEAERVRLLDQARREIDQQMRVAHRELVEHAATLAVSTAETRIKQQITDADQARLVDRYLTQVASHE